MKDLYVGVPVVIGANGVERIVEVELNGAERDCSRNRSPSVQSLVEACKKIAPELSQLRRQDSHGRRDRTLRSCRNSV